MCTESIVLAPLSGERMIMRCWTEAKQSCDRLGLQGFTLLFSPSKSAMTSPSCSITKKQWPQIHRHISSFIICIYSRQMNQRVSILKRLNRFVSVFQNTPYLSHFVQKMTNEPCLNCNFYDQCLLRVDSCERKVVKPVVAPQDTPTDSRFGKWATKDSLRQNSDSVINFDSQNDELCF